MPRIDTANSIENDDDSLENSEGDANDFKADPRVKLNLENISEMAPGNRVTIKIDGDLSPDNLLNSSIDKRSIGKRSRKSNKSRKSRKSSKSRKSGRSRKSRMSRKSEKIIPLTTAERKQMQF
jgi:hypothetical protein